MEGRGMKNRFENHNIFNQGGTLILLIRVGIACLGITTLLYIFWPTTLNSIFELLFPHQAFINVIRNYPGFDQDWLSVASLITASFYIYSYMALVLVLSNILGLLKDAKLLVADGRDQWNLLSYAIVGRLDFKSHSLKREEYRSGSSVIRAYSKSREGAGSVVLDVISVIAVTYIGYSSLQSAPSHGGLITRIMDSMIVGLWCYSIFSIFMWIIFVFAAWFQYFVRNIKI
jgi:hypothetical protein